MTYCVSLVHNSITTSETPRMIYLWQHAEFLDAVDVKDTLQKVNSNYSKFIDFYADHLKTL